MRRPRLRSMKSMKRSGSPSGCDTEGVFELGAGDAVFGGDGLEVLARPEQAEDIGDAAAAMGEDRLPEAALGVGDDLGGAVAGKPDEAGVAVRSVVDASQVLLDDLAEDLLFGAHDDQLPDRPWVEVPVVLGEVVEDFGTVGVQLSAGEGVLDAEAPGELLEGGADALERHARGSHGGEHHAFGEPDEGDGRPSWGGGLERGDDRLADDRRPPDCRW